MTADIIVILVYFCAIFGIGLYVGRKQTSLETYALGNRDMPWWAIVASILAAEISAATFLGTPGEGFVHRNFTYAQLAIGAILGRIIVGRLFLKPYYQYQVISIYEYLEKRFGRHTRLWASATFLLTRVLASGARLYFAGILLVVAYMAITGQATMTDEQTLIAYVGALLIISISTAIYTTLGGLKAVVWTDVLQASILAIAIVTTIGILIINIRGDASWTDTWNYIVTTMGDTSGNPAGVELRPFQIISFGLIDGGVWDNIKSILSQEYTIWSAVLGATFVAMATHGTDQDMVQRMLAAKDSKTGSRAVILSGIIDLPVVLVFLSCGILLFVFFQKNGIPMPEKKLEIFPYFIIHYLPAGIRGLLIAALLATAMGSLSTALNALATTAARDWYRDVWNPKAHERQMLAAARWLTVGFALLLIVVGVAVAWYVVHDANARIIPLALGIFGYTYGSLLGVFLLGMLTRKRGNDKGNIIAMVAGFLTIIYLEVGKNYGFAPEISFTWRVTIGTLVTFLVGYCFRTLERKEQA